MDNNTRKHASRSAAWGRTTNLINCGEFKTPMVSWKHLLHYTLDFFPFLLVKACDQHSRILFRFAIPLFVPYDRMQPKSRRRLLCQGMHELRARVSRNKIPHYPSIDNMRALVGHAALAIKP